MAEKEKQDYRVEMGSPPRSPRMSAGGPATSTTGNPIFPILSYCGASILMTVTNKYVLSGYDFNLNFFLLCVQVSFLACTVWVVR